LGPLVWHLLLFLPKRLQTRKVSRVVTCMSYCQASLEKRFIIDVRIFSFLFSRLITHPSKSLSFLLISYNTTLSSLLDKHAPVITKLSRRPSSSSVLPLYSSISPSLFHCRLKTYLFHKSYPRSSTSSSLDFCPDHFF